ncbi:hypothetical protein SAMN05518668_101420 [Sphingobium sp. YR657]|uniref:hypothetical protein n=1 Tax=Sphingobium sp. YR657 TaxID=1884366 RepID=UPI0009120B43|nr:hypothetical protein [Sphingobium sp. YR657]SHL52709.1 hypothetical protein SAMN05518668_101420 [Sphingobium sp. YR657]
MLKYIPLAAGVVLLATSAGAQNHQAGSHNPATKNGAPHQVASPARGANSFTEDQARGRFAKAGYRNVTKVWKKDGLWYATATKNGKRHSVALDYKGNITRR